VGSLVVLICALGGSAAASGAVTSPSKFCEAQNLDGEVTAPDAAADPPKAHQHYQCQAARAWVCVQQQWQSASAPQQLHSKGGCWQHLRLQTILRAGASMCSPVLDLL
jgi:hypothetical protein